MRQADPVNSPELTGAYARQERLLEAFEAAWQRGERPAIDAYLPRAGREPELLLDFLQADLEYRLKAGEAARAEDYLTRFPQAADDSAFALALIVREYQLRQRHEPGLHPDEYTARFPQYRDELARRLRPAAGAVPRSAGALDTLVPSCAWAGTGAGGAAWERPPTYPVLPGYEILGELGRGGMGVVYKALQLRLNRVVALKMVLAGEHARPEDLVRFLAEAEAVAHLQHPGIGQVFEIGAHAGLPFFVLEYLEGGSLQQRLQGTPLPAREAARLVATLARAVQAAHDSGIIHRDLKPANVLLDKEGRPKISDFGLAKRVADGPGLTQSGVILGTPSYMAPEQAAGQGKAVGPAVDVYALGAILYELLTGRPPFRGTTALDTLDQVRSEDPVPPIRLARQVPRDLQTICLKCLRKEPRQRYASAANLADDLERFLADRPIKARSIGPWEKAWKWARRRPAEAALFAVSLAALVSLVGGGIWHVLRMETALQEAHVARVEADRQRQVAEANQQQAERAAQEAHANAATAGAVADFLAGLFQTADPTGLRSSGFRSSGPQAAALNAHQILDRGAAAVRTQLKDQPAVQAAMLDILGNVYRSLGESERAGPLLRDGLRIRQERYGHEHLETAKSLFHLAWLQQDLGEYQDAERLYRESLRIRQKFLSHDDLLVADTMFNLAWVLVHQFPERNPSAGQFAESEKLFREVLRIRRAKLGNNHRDVAFVLTALAALSFGRGEEFKAQGLLLDAAVIFQQSQEVIPTGNVLVTYYRAEQARRAGRLEEAVQLQQQVLAFSRIHLGDQHPITGLALGNLAGLLRRKGDLPGAEKVIREALSIGRHSPLRRHPMVIEALNGLADVVQARGDGTEIEALPLLGASTVALLGSSHGAGPLLAAAALVPGRAEAEMLYREAFAIAQARLARNHRLFRETLDKLTALLRKQGRLKDAEALGFPDKTLPH